MFKGQKSQKDEPNKRITFHRKDLLENRTFDVNFDVKLTVLSERNSTKLQFDTKRLARFIISLLKDLKYKTI